MELTNTYLYKQVQSTTLYRTTRSTFWPDEWRLCNRQHRENRWQTCNRYSCVWQWYFCRSCCVSDSL